MFLENQHIEFKENYKSSTIASEIVAFLNTCDGIIYIGIKNDGTIKGIENIDVASLYISNIIINQIEPSPRNYISIDTPIIEGKNIIKIMVKKGKELYYLKKHGLSVSGCFERIGSSCRGMSVEQIKTRLLDSVKSKIKITNIEAEEQDLKFRNIKWLYVQEGLTVNNSSFYKNEKFLTKDGKFNLLAELLADKNKFSIKIARFNGDLKSDNMIFRNEYGNQCLIIAMKNALNFCSEIINQTKTIFHRDGYREDIKLFDNTAFREAWFNACIHNDWIDSTPPAIYLFNNRLEIISTGGLPSNMTKDDFFGGISKPVNEQLAKILIKLGVIEQTGHGVTKIVEQYGKEAFTFFDNFIRVTIPFNYDLNENNENVTVNDENVTVNDENVTVNHENVTVNHENVTVNHENVTVNDENVTVNHENVTVNHENVTVNHENVTVKDENVTVNHENVTVNHENVTVKDENVTVKDENVTVNDENVTVNDENVTVKDENVTIKNENVTIKNENDTIKDKNDTIKDRNGTIKYKSQNVYISDEDKIISSIINNKRITIDEMAVVIGKTKRTVIRLLIKSKRIKRVGSDKSGYWKIEE